LRRGLYINSFKNFGALAKVTEVKIKSFYDYPNKELLRYDGIVKIINSLMEKEECIFF
jgi:hypothetical protein